MFGAKIQLVNPKLIIKLWNQKRQTKLWKMNIILKNINVESVAALIKLNKLVANYVILGKNQKVEKGQIKTQTP